MQHVLHVVRLINEFVSLFNFFAACFMCLMHSSHTKKNHCSSPMFTRHVFYCFDWQTVTLLCVILQHKNRTHWGRYYSKMPQDTFKLMCIEQNKYMNKYNHLQNNNLVTRTKFNRKCIKFQQWTTGSNDYFLIIIYLICLKLIPVNSEEYILEALRGKKEEKSDVSAVWSAGKTDREESFLLQSWVHFTDEPAAWQGRNNSWHAIKLLFKHWNT